MLRSKSVRLGVFIVAVLCCVSPPSFITHTPVCCCVCCIELEVLFTKRAQQREKKKLMKLKSFLNSQELEPLVYMPILHSIGVDDVADMQYINSEQLAAANFKVVHKAKLISAIQSARLKLEL